ncbi:helix-turn-helix domain-containing protein [Streptomyces sp. H27-D2]|uniref:helix-turn-helix domain-containing protein n=1 Tax=Streptomyces sp. H27-D2 TaxID=3046304 RepID=UPI002DBC76CA|nr:helix-turn-helix transcriptional regulator [Streptomyces sp. H27-D2]MEC4018098.1 helix-turn-helix transcriptional regulator [Streptomyces sp. H27-D2]
MPPRDAPTVRQVRLGVELRKLRECAGRTARDAADLLGVDQARVSNIEAGRMGIGEERIRRLAVFYDCQDAALVDALCAIARERRGQFWWDEYRGVLPPGFLDIAELEQHATYLRSIQTLSLPGLLQTEEYARALFSSVVTSLPTAEIEARIEHRLKRQAILGRQAPPQFDAIIHEAALRMRFGGRKVTRGQLEQVLEASERPAVAVRVLPFSNERFIEVTQPILYAGGVVPQLDTVQMDSHLGGNYWNGEAELQMHRMVLDVAEGVSLDAEKSRDLIHRIAREL